MLRGCLTIFLLLAGVFAFGLAFEAAAGCSRDGAGGYAVFIGALLFGAGVLLAGIRFNWRPWVSWGVAVATAIVASFVVSAAALLRWVGECSQ